MSIIFREQVVKLQTLKMWSKFAFSFLRPNHIMWCLQLSFIVSLVAHNFPFCNYSNKSLVANCNFLVQYKHLHVLLASGQLMLAVLFWQPLAFGVMICKSKGTSFISTENAKSNPLKLHMFV